MPSDVITVDMDTLEEALYIEHTPGGYGVFSEDGEGELVSTYYDKKDSAQIWLAGWTAAMERVESRS